MLTLGMFPQVHMLIYNVFIGHKICCELFQEGEGKKKKKKNCCGLNRLQLERPKYRSFYMSIGHFFRNEYRVLL